MARATVNSLYSGHCKDLDLVFSIAISSPLYLEFISVWDSAAVRIRGVTVIARCLQCESWPHVEYSGFQVTGMNRRIFWGLKFPIPGFFWGMAGRPRDFFGFFFFFAPFNHPLHLKFGVPLWGVDCITRDIWCQETLLLIFKLSHVERWNKTLTSAKPHHLLRTEII